ncbi:hypothetical protein E2320_022865, partial [Naja naja]
MFAVSMVNKDFLLLPNITLGFHIYIHFHVEMFISLNSLSMLSSQGQVVPGYKCDQEDTLLSLGVGFEFSAGDRIDFPSFLWINHKESPQYVGLVQLLLYFQWNWVGLLSSESDNGEHFISTLTPMLKEKEICLAFTERLKYNDFQITLNNLIRIFIIWPKIEVFILFGDSTVTSSVQGTVAFFQKIKKILFRKIWILTSHWKLSMNKSPEILQYIKPFYGALHFRDRSGDISEFTPFLLSLDPLNPQG